MKDLRLTIAFLTRIPMPAGVPSAEQGALAKAMWAFPLAGGIVGGLGGLVFLLTTALGIPELVASILTVAVLIGITGALHEDGLADMADGTGGTTRTKKLEIMKDSRIGTYGVISLIVIITLKIGTLSAYAGQTDALQLLLLLVFGGATSRTAIVVVSFLLPPAKADGLSTLAGRPSVAALAAALILAGLGGFILLPVVAAFLGLVGATLGAGLIILIAQRTIGGQSGDVLGATQQVAEVGLFLGALIAFA